MMHTTKEKNASTADCEVAFVDASVKWPVMWWNLPSTKGR